MDPDKCPICGATIPKNGDFCKICGAHRRVVRKNYCINPKCVCYGDSSLVTPEQQICVKCGQPTSFGKEVLEKC